MSVLTRLREKFPVLIPPKVKAEARVAIAKDVIDTLAVGRMSAVTGYGYFTLTDSARGVGEQYEAIALALRTKGKTRCRVCAIGAACLSAVGLYDDAEDLESNFSYGDVGSNRMRDVLARWFSRKQLDLIECAYERTTHFNYGGSSERLRVRAKEFGFRYLDSRERLEAIMQNVVDNGTFKP